MRTVIVVAGGDGSMSIIAHRRLSKSREMTIIPPVLSIFLSCLVKTVCRVDPVAYPNCTDISHSLTPSQHPLIASQNNEVRVSHSLTPPQQPLRALTLNTTTFMFPTLFLLRM